MFDKLIDLIIEFIRYFWFWRVIPKNKRGVRIRWGKNPVELKPGFHLILPFEIDHVDACIVEPEWTTSDAVHMTTLDLKTISVGPTVKYRIVDIIAWYYAENDAFSNLHNAMRLATSSELTDCTWDDCMKKSTWTRIKNRIKEKTKNLGIEIEDFGLIDLAVSRIIITTLNQ